MDVKANLGQSKCPNYRKAVFINAILHPRAFTGLGGTISFDNTYNFFGKSKYKLNSSIYLNRNKFGFGLTSTELNNNAPEKSGEGGDDGSGELPHLNKSTISQKMDMDLMGNVSIKGRINVFGNLWKQTNVLLNWSKIQKIYLLADWADDKFNVQVSMKNTTIESNEREYMMNFMRKLSDHCMFGGQCTLFKTEHKPTLVLKGYEGMLRYQRGYMIYVATLDHYLSATLRFTTRINSHITLGVEMKHNLSENKSKCMWLHRIVVTDRVEVKAQFDSDATMAGSVFWNFANNFTVSLSTKLNCNMDDFGMGVELGYKFKSPQDSYR